MVAKNICTHSASALKAMVCVSILDFPLSKSKFSVFQNSIRAPLFGWQALCVRNPCAVSSGSSNSVKTCHSRLFALQRLVCSHAAFSLRHRESDVGVEREHESNRRGLQCLLRWSLRHLYQQNLCRQRNECNHYRPGPGSHLLFCGDNVCCRGHGKSVLKRSVLSGSAECSECWSDNELFKHLYRRCLHKPFPVQDKHAAVWS